MSQKGAFVKKGEGGAQPNISKEKIVATLMPLPSLAEQYRIVAKIKEVLPYIEHYGEACSTANSLNTSFPDLLKKSILQEAVQGKLVPQNPDDEPASVLLEHIRAEKERLIKAGKIKRDKHESIIFRRDKAVLTTEALHEPFYRFPHVNAAAAFCLKRIQPSICIRVFFNESRVPALVFILILGAYEYAKLALNWNELKPEMESYLARYNLCIDDIDVYDYEDVEDTIDE